MKKNDAVHNIVVLDNGQFEKPRWNLFSLTAYTLMFDPYILSMGVIPQLVHPKDRHTGTDGDIIFYPYPLEDESVIKHLGESGRQGSKLLLVQPGCSAQKEIPDLKRLGSVKRFVSLKETVSFCWKDTRRYVLPDNLFFQVYENRFDRVLASVGDVPAGGIIGRNVVFSIDPMDFLINTSYENYVDPPRDVSLLLALALRHIQEKPLSESEISTAREHEELRRDFHGYGFARAMLEQLSILMKSKERLNYDEADKAVISAARALVAGEKGKAGAGLKKAFTLLLHEREKLYNGQIYLFDLLHGGGMFQDCGFFEYDWPQHVAWLFRSYLHLSASRGYRFNLDVMAKSLEHLAERFPVLRREIAEGWRKGWLDIVNGTYGHPFPQLYDTELGLRQYELGVKEIEKQFGKKPTIFANQEFGFTPQIPQITRGFGYDAIVQRVYNNGDCKVLDVPLVDWRGPDGSGMKTLPSFRTQTQRKYEYIYENISFLIAEDISYGYPWVTISCHGDQTFYRFFREELVRTAYYAPVLGKFITYRDFFAEVKEKSVEQSFSMDDFESCWCLDYSRWSFHRDHTGDNLKNFIKALETERAILMAGAIQSFAHIKTGAECASLEDAWKALSMYASHDAMMVSRFTQGAFFHQTAFPGYCGPLNRKLNVGHIAGRDLEESKKEATQAAGKTLSGLAGQGDTHWVIFNPLSFDRQAAVNLPGNDKGSVVSLPALGYRRVPKNFQTPGQDTTRVDGRSLTMENNFLKIILNPEDGSIKSWVDKNTGAELLAGPANRLVMGKSSTTEIMAWDAGKAAGAQASMSTKGIISSVALGRCRFETEYSLHATDSIIRMKTSFDPDKELKGDDQWTDSIRASYTIGRGAKVYRLTQNFCEETSRGRFTSLLYCSCLTAAGRMNLLNAGTLAYRRDNDSIDTVLLCESESLRTFSTALSFGTGSIMRETLSWQSPPFMVPAGAGPESESLLSLNNDNLVVLSVEPAGDRALSLRIAETEGLATSAAIEFGFPLKAAVLTDFMGKEIQPIDVTKSKLSYNLSAWQIIQIRVEFQ